jgi:hypothetical protein
MREIRTSGSEGGAGRKSRSYLYLSRDLPTNHDARQDNINTGGTRAPRHGSGPVRSLAPGFFAHLAFVVLPFMALPKIIGRT